MLGTIVIKFKKPGQTDTKTQQVMFKDKYNNLLNQTGFYQFADVNAVYPNNTLGKTNKEIAYDFYLEKQNGMFSDPANKVITSIDTFIPVRGEGQRDFVVDLTTTGGRRRKSRRNKRSKRSRTKKSMTQRRSRGRTARRSRSRA